MIAGLLVEVADLAAARTFYQTILAGTLGTWEQTRRSVIFRNAHQTLELVRRRNPRATGETARHQAYRVPADRIDSTVAALRSAGHVVHHWHEDHPSERGVMAYAEDPSGNLVQLVPAGDPDGRCLDHVALEFVDLEYAEDFYVCGLGARVEGDYGWSTDIGPELKAWLAGGDPAAPWTRYQEFSFRSRTVEARATPQLCLTLGDTRLHLFLARKHLQEPPEELIRGTPRVVLESDGSAADLAAHLAGPARARISARYRGRTIKFEQDGRIIYLRDPGGNHVQVICARS